MRLLHYSNKIIDKIDNRFVNVEGRIKKWAIGKPVGFWVSVEGDYDWEWWCNAENFRVDHLQYVYEVTIKENASILHLRTCDEIKCFTIEYINKPSDYIERLIAGDLTFREVDTYDLDWVRVGAKYNGIIISPYQWDLRLSTETSWYYGWDCASGCIWNTDVIEKVTLVKGPLEEVEICKFCDPDHFVIYGDCKKCGRVGQPPLMDIDLPIGMVKR